MITITETNPTMAPFRARTRTRPRRIPGHRVGGAMPRPRAALLCGAVALLAAPAGCGAARAAVDPAPCLDPTCESEIAASGWFHVVWNDVARFYLVAEDGSATELLIDEVVAAEHGGRLALDRTRVSVRGVPLSDAVLRVTAIRPDPPPGGGS